MIPRLETERLVLRALTQADFEPLADFFASDAARFVGRPDGSRHGLAPCRGFGRQLGAAWLRRVRGRGKKASGKFAGLIGPWFPEGWPEQEIGWIVPGRNSKARATAAGGGGGGGGGGRPLNGQSALPMRSFGWETAHRPALLRTTSLR